MSNTRATIQLLTVGSGTAGPFSNVAEGIIAALLLDRPDVAYLAPSRAPESQAVAEIVREGCRERGYDCVRSTPAGEAFFSFSDPDDIDRCRTETVAMLNTIRIAHPNAHLVLNPTSGTKQMTAAAVLAAMDLGIGELRFITGLRVDGVIKTGFERVSAFNTRAFMVERAANEAAELLRGGAYTQAARVAGAYLPELADLDRQARLYAAWNRCDYGPALRVAEEGSGAFWAEAVSALRSLVAGGPVSLANLADLLAAARRALERDLPEEALVRAYRLTELAAKLRLAELTVKEPYMLDDLLVRLPKCEHEQIKRCARQGRVTLGLRHAIQLLDALGDSLGRALFNDESVVAIMDMRNESVYGHGTKSAHTDNVARCIEAVVSLLVPHFRGLRTQAKAFAFSAPLPH